ncbi:hypothetical protein CLF_102522 [Clonorchis sinensis]|uniref:Uncharacterized protein n=1 Tax=Clonorchis sinensis TaxID=79923 RepID=G7Y831_CLOSI|nr:hypothetical protein CLF_102522 [Clonorchis sinensis]
MNVRAKMVCFSRNRETNLAGVFNGVEIPSADYLLQCLDARESLALFEFTLVKMFSKSAHYWQVNLFGSLIVFMIADYKPNRTTQRDPEDQTTGMVTVARSLRCVLQRNSETSTYARERVLDKTIERNRRFTNPKRIWSTFEKEQAENSMAALLFSHTANLKRIISDYDDDNDRDVRFGLHKQSSLFTDPSTEFPIPMSVFHLTSLTSVSFTFPNIASASVTTATAKDDSTEVAQTSAIGEVTSTVIAVQETAQTMSNPTTEPQGTTLQANTQDSSAPSAGFSERNSLPGYTSTNVMLKGDRLLLPCVHEDQVGKGLNWSNAHLDRGCFIAYRYSIKITMQQMHEKDLCQSVVKRLIFGDRNGYENPGTLNDTHTNKEFVSDYDASGHPRQCDTSSGWAEHNGYSYSWKNRRCHLKYSRKPNNKIRGG